MDFISQTILNPQKQRARVNFAWLFPFGPLTFQAAQKVSRALSEPAHDTGCGNVFTTHTPNSSLHNGFYGAAAVPPIWNGYMPVIHDEFWRNPYIAAAG